MALQVSPALPDRFRPTGITVTSLAWVGAIVGVALVLLSGAALTMYWPLLPVAALAAVLVVAWCIQRPSRWVYLLITTIYLESSDLSFYVGGARVRPAQILLLPIVFCTLMQGIAGSVRLRRVPLMIPLLVYLGCNFVSTALSPVPDQCLKISLLLTSLVLVYAVTYTLVRDDPAAWPSLFRFFVIVGLIEIVIGYYQVAAGYANALLGLSLPIGHLGMIHADYIGTIFGRPYGTLPEPDTFGAVCVLYSLLLGLMWLTASVPRTMKRLTPLTAVAAIGGLLVGIVRAAWFGFLFGLLWIVFMHLTGRLRGIRPLRVAAVIGLAALTGAVSLTSPRVQKVLIGRFTQGPGDIQATLSKENARYVQMAMSWRLFRERPVFGNGPGSFSVLGWMGANEFYYLTVGVERRLIYDPSILTTVLNDTGVVGSAAFLVLVAAYFGRVRRRLRRIAGRSSRNQALAAHCAMVGLFASFIFTQYFWLPFTWLFLAMTMLLLEFGGITPATNHGQSENGTPAASPVL